MWIETSRDGLRRLFNADVIPDELEDDVEIDDYHLEFSENGVAQVKRPVGEAYIAHYDDISERSESGSDE